MAGAEPKAYKGKDGQVYQLFFKDQDDEEDEQVEDVRTLTTSAVDPYSDLNIHPPLAGARSNPFRTTSITQHATKRPQKATVSNKVAGTEDVVLFEKKTLHDSDSEDDETELDTLLRGRNGDAVAVSMESIDIGKTADSKTKRFLIKTDSDLDLLVHEPSRFDEIKARGRWVWASLQRCPPWQSYIRVALVIAGVFLLYVVLIVVILQVLGT